MTSSPPALLAGALTFACLSAPGQSILPKDLLARGRLQFHPDGKRLLEMFALTGQPERLQSFDLNSGELTPRWHLIARW